MTISWLIDNSTFRYRECIEEDVQCLAEMLYDVKKNGEGIIVNEEINYVNFTDNQLLCDWIYSKDPEYKNERRLLLKLINTKKIVSLSESIDIQQNPHKNRVGFLALTDLESEMPSRYLAKSVDQIINVRRIFLHDIETSSEFMVEVNGCFPNLVFGCDVKNSIDTLSLHIRYYKNEVIKHLSKINDNFIEIFDKYHKDGLNMVIERFSCETGLEASLEGDRKKADRLKFNFIDKSGKVISLVCEPHTKLFSSGIQGDTVYRYDRIYFREEYQDIENGKILIGYIGKHI